MTDDMTANGPVAASAAALPGPAKGRVVNEQLRGLAVAAVLRGGMSRAAAARRFGLSPGSVNRFVKQFLERGHLRPGGHGGGTSRIERARERIMRILAAQPDLSMYGLRDALAAEGVKVHAGTLQRFLKRRGLDRRSRRAARRDGGNAGY